MKKTRRKETRLKELRGKVTCHEQFPKHCL